MTEKVNERREINEETTSMEMKPLIVYYSNFKTHSGEVAHKLALGLRGDIYEIKTPNLVFNSKLHRDGYKKQSHIPIVFDVLDYKPYNPIYIVGETYGKHVIGPVRNWVQQNKTELLEQKKEFVFCIYGKKSQKAINDLKSLIGEPKECIVIDKFQYPLNSEQLIHPSLQPTKTKVNYKQRVHQFLHT